MEPFELALSQVNFEGNDLSSTPSGQQPLHSFSNLVSYDSEFDDAAGLPVSARRLPKTGEASSVSSQLVAVTSGTPSHMHAGASLYSSFTGPQNGGPHAHTYLVNGSDGIIVDPDENYYKDKPSEEWSTTSSSASTPSKKSSGQNSDSFRGFTETVEALALQKSVIGASTVTPASAEEVARVIALTQMKMKGADSDSLQESQSSDGGGTTACFDDHIPLGNSVSASPTAAHDPSLESQSSDGGGTTARFDDHIPLGNSVSASPTAAHDPSLVGVHTHSAGSSDQPASDMTVQNESGAMQSEIRAAERISADVKQMNKSLDSNMEVVESVLTSSPVVADASSSALSSVTPSAVASTLHDRPDFSHERSLSSSSSELIPVPPDMITKVTERKGWLSGRSVVSPEQARPAERSMTAGGDSIHDPTHQQLLSSNTTADTDFDPHPFVMGSGDSGNAQGGQSLNTTVSDHVQSESVIHDQERWPPAGAEAGQEERDIRDVEKLKGQYDFDTNSYLETMETFTSLPKPPLPATSVTTAATGPCLEESGAARFSPPVKDPGMLPSSERERKGRHLASAKRQVPEADNKQKDSLGSNIAEKEDADNLLLPFKLPLNTSTPLKGTESQEERNSKDEVVLSTGKVVKQTPVCRETLVKEHPELNSHVSKTSSEKVEEALIPDQDITDPSPNTHHVSWSSPCATEITLNPSTKESGLGDTMVSQTGSLVVNLDETTSRARPTSDDSIGDLSLGSSSEAAGEGAELNRSERADYYSLREEVAALRRERAHLEGQLEVLEGEARAAIKDRSELQSHLAAVGAQLRSQENSARTVVGDRNALAADLETLKQNRQRLELVVMDAQKLIEEKDHDLKTLHEDLKLAQAASEKAQERAKELRSESMAKDETVQALKSKVAELYVEYQNNQQARILAENETQSLRDDVRSLQTAKEWYQTQLKQSQEAKGRLQQEISRVQGENIASLTLVERLKADNVRVKINLAEQQQRALQEKEMLARHLEAIERDMLEREAAFAQMQLEREAAEVAMKQEEERLRQMENDVSSLEDLKKLQNDLRRKQAQVNVLEHEQAQLVKRLTLAQESLLERDHTIDGLDQKYVDMEVLYKNLQKELDARDEEVLKLKTEKNALEIELTSTKEEKKSFDITLHTIKDDMGKVEHGFKQMKQELAARTNELREAQSKNEDLNKQLAVTRARLRVFTQKPRKQVPNDNQVEAAVEKKEARYELAPVHHEKSIQEDLVVKIVEPGQKEDSKPEVMVLTQRESEAISLDQANNSITDLDNELIHQLRCQRDDLEKSLQEVEHQKAALQKELLSEKEALSAQLVNLQHKLDSVTSSQKSYADRYNMADRELVETKERLLQMEVNLRTVVEEKQALEERLRETEDQIRAQRDAASDAVEEREAIAQLEKENTMLRSKILEGKKQQTQETNKLKAKVLQVTEEYEHRLDEERDRQVDYQAAVSELNQRLREAERAREYIHQELVATEQRLNLSLDEQKVQLQTQSQELINERQAFEEEQRKVRLEVEEMQASILLREETIEILRTKISEIEVQYREAKELLEESEKLRQEEDARRLSLDLEREKGKLAGVLQSHSALKEHTTTLEAALARREASVAGLSTHVQGELLKRDKLIHELREQLREQETALAKEKQNVKDTKKQLMTEKGQHIKLRRQMETLWVDQDQVRVDLQSRTNDLNLTTLEVEKTKLSYMQLKSESERQATELQSARREVEQLKRDLLESEQQEPVLRENIQTLEWQLQQRTLEMDAMREKLQLVEERQSVEVSSLNKALQATTTELSTTKEELARLRQEYLQLTTKVAQLKSALKSSMSHSKKRREEKEAEATKSLPPPFDVAAMERLLQDTAPVSVESKPLSFLQATLSGLRGEISNLQHQVDQHTSAVQTSSMAWMELEEHVKELREVCKTSAAGRAALQALVPAEGTSPDIPASAATEGSTSGTAEVHQPSVSRAAPVIDV